MQKKKKKFMHSVHCFAWRRLAILFQVWVANQCKAHKKYYRYSFVLYVLLLVIIIPPYGPGDTIL